MFHTKYHLIAGLLSIALLFSGSTGYSTADAAPTNSTQAPTGKQKKIVKYVAPPKKYVYIRSSASIDDSWIGTPVSFINNTPTSSSLVKTVEILSDRITVLSSDLEKTNTRLSNLGGGYTYVVSAPVLTFSDGFTQTGNHIGLISGSNGTVLTMSGSTPVWTAPAPVSVSVASIFGRTGSVIGQLGDYTTSLITEGSNLYFTDARAENALSGSIASIQGSISTINTNLTSTNTSLINTNTSLTSAINSISTLSGNLAVVSNFTSTKENILTFNNGLSRAGDTIGLISGSNGAVLTMSGGTPVWTAPAITGWSLVGNAGTNLINQFIGTTDDTDLIFRRNNIESFRISGASGNLVTVADIQINGLTVGRGGGNISSNTAIGTSALQSNTSGGINTAVGAGAMYNNTTGSFNSAIGLYSLMYNTTGTNNTSIGFLSSSNITSGSNNTIIGTSTAGGITTGSGNTIIGANVTGLSPTLSNNIIIADGAGNRRINVSSTGAVGIGTNYPRALLDVAGDAFINGVTIGRGGGNLSSNTAIGSGAMSNNTTGTNNTAIGANSLFFNTTGGFNTAQGLMSLYSNTNGHHNVAQGLMSLYSNTTGFYNVAQGTHSLYSNTAGYGNTVQGASAMYNNTTGNFNTAIGDSAGSGITTGSLNIAIGYNAQVASATGTNQLSIGNWIYGTNGNIGIGTSTPLAKLSIDTGDISIAGATGSTRSLNFNTKYDGSVVASINTYIGQTRGASMRGWVSREWGGAGTQNGFVMTVFDDPTGYPNQNTHFSINSTGSLASDKAVLYVGVGSTGSNTRPSAVFERKVGIGTTNPGALLDVAGDAFINGVTVGRGSGNVLGNTIVGSGALQFNTTGYLNTAQGFSALYNTTTGFANTAFGYFAGSGITTGSSNIAIGYDAQVASATGTNQLSIGNWIYGTNGNIGIGTSTPLAKLSIKGSGSTDAPGYGSDILVPAGWTPTNWTGDAVNGWTHIIGNTSVLSHSTSPTIGQKYQITYTITGRTAGYFNLSFGGQGQNSVTTTGTFGPTATTTDGLTMTPSTDFNGTVVISIKPIGAQSSPIMTFASSDGVVRTEIRASNIQGNHLIGVGAGRMITTGFNNTGFGNGVLYNTTTGNYNTSIGNVSMFLNTTGFSNTALGHGSLYTNTIGSFNSAIGTNALYYNSTGSNNTAQGTNSLYSNTIGTNNTAQGASALNNSISGIHNTAQGANALNKSISGNYNTAQGSNALYNSSGGSNNTAQGTNTLYQLTSGSNNTAIGYNTAGGITTGSGNTIIGANVTGLSPTLSSNIIIADGYGNQRINVSATGAVGIGTNTPGYKLEVNGDINSIGTVRANGIVLSSDARFKQGVASISNATDILSKLNPVTYTWNLLGQEHGGQAGTTEYGFLAQDVESVLPSAVSTNISGYKSLNYIDFIPHLVGAVKDIVEKENNFSGSIISLGNLINTQANIVSKTQDSIVNLQSQIDSIKASPTITPVINNTYYTTSPVQTGSLSESIQSALGDLGISAQHLGSLVWTHSESLISQITLNDITPRDALSYITQLFNTATDIIYDFIVYQITAIYGYFEEIWTKTIHMQKLCIGNTGDETCIDKAQLDALILSKNQPNTINNTANISPSTTQGTPQISGNTDTSMSGNTTSAFTGNSNTTSTGTSDIPTLATADSGTVIGATNSLENTGSITTNSGSITTPTEISGVTNTTSTGVSDVPSATAPIIDPTVTSSESGGVTP